MDERDRAAGVMRQHWVLHLVCDQPLLHKSEPTRMEHLCWGKRHTHLEADTRTESFVPFPLHSLLTVFFLFVVTKTEIQNGNDRTIPVSAVKARLSGALRGREIVACA